MSLAEAFQENPDAAEFDMDLSKATQDDTNWVIDDRYTVMTDSPLPEFASPGTKAFSARNNENPNRSIFALLLDTKMSPRSYDMSTLKRLERTSTLRPRSWAVVYHQAAQCEKFCIVLDRPGGRHVFDQATMTCTPWPEDRLIERFIRPIVSMLRLFQGAQLVHRAINVNNLFFQDAVTGEVIVGECFSAPAGYHQPVIFETVGAGLSNPAGRGPGTPADDLYAIAVCMIFMYFGRNPAAHLSDAEILQLKIEQGSFAALIGNNRVTFSLMEPLRGLLSDDRNDRWRLSELELWLNGRRLTPIQHKQLPKSARPFTFADQEYNTTQTLSYAFWQHWNLGLECISKEPVDQWIRRSLSNEALADQFMLALRSAGAYGGSHSIEDRMLGRACIVLDSMGPIRYRSIAFRINGFATLLMQKMIFDQPLVDLEEAILARLPLFWLDLQVTQRSDHTSMRRDYELLPSVLHREGPGFGIERILYELNPGLPCISPMLKSSYVLIIDHIIPALAKVDRKSYAEPMDRHIAAFIASRIDANVDSQIQALGLLDDQVKRRMGIIRLLAEVQQKTAQKTPMNLAQWIADIAEPIIESYHNSVYRNRLSKEVRRLINRGAPLMEIALSLENTSRRERDNEGFIAAAREYEDAENEIARIEANEMTDPQLIITRGQAFATMASALLASVALIGVIAVRLLIG